MPFTPILATLGYVFSPDRAKVLMVHRTGRERDFHNGKWNGLGGKLERDEDIVTGLCRELREEAGIECVDVQLAGTVSWPGFGKNGEDWFGFLFRIFAFTGTVAERSPEGPLAWIPVSDVLGLNVWDGDRHFLPTILDPTAGPFHGVMPYADGRPLSWGVRSFTS